MMKWHVQLSLGFDIPHINLLELNNCYTLATPIEQRHVPQGVWLSEFLRSFCKQFITYCTLYALPYIYFQKPLLQNQVRVSAK